MRNAGDDFVLPLEAARIVHLALGAAALHDLQHGITAQPIAPSEVHGGEIAGGDFLDDGVAGHLDPRCITRRPERSLGRRRRRAAFGGFADRLEQGVPRDARERQIVVGAALHDAHCGQLVAVLGEHDTVQLRLPAQHVLQVGKSAVRRRFIAEVHLEHEGVGNSLLDQRGQGRRVVGGNEGHLRVGPVAGHVMGQPLKPLGLGAHHHQDRTGRVCHKESMIAE